MAGHLRYKKGKSLCTLIPEKNRFLSRLFLGAEEREKNGSNEG